MECFGQRPPVGSPNASVSSSTVTAGNNMGPPGISEEMMQIRSILGILYTIFFAILCPLITVCNVVIIAVFARMEKLNGQSVYKISIAFSDLTFGIIAFPVYIGFIHSGGPMQDLLNAFLCIQRISLMVSVFAMLAMGFDRLYAVLRPIHYDSDKARKVAIRATIVIWVTLCAISLPLSILAPIPMIAQAEGDLVVRWGNMMGETVVLLIALILVWMNNFTVYLILQKKMNATDLGDSTNSSRLKRHKDVVITLCIMTGAFTLSTLPVVIYNIIVLQNKCRLINMEYQIPEMIVFVIFVTNCVWNCFVYSFRHKEFRDKAKNIFFCGREAPSVAEEVLTTRTNTATI